MPAPTTEILPENNREWWLEKLGRNLAGDGEKDEELDKLAWVVVHVWEHKDPVIAADAIQQLRPSRRQLVTRRRGCSPERVTCEILVDVHEIREDPGCP